MVKFLKRLVVFIPLVMLALIYMTVGCVQWLFIGEFENRFTKFITYEVGQPLQEWADES